jgi:plasmid stabilization system protein ParE
MTVEGFRDRLSAARALLSEFPMAGKPATGRTRRLSLTPYPYSLVYRVLPDRVTVVAVAHDRQRDRPWPNR